VTPIYSIKYDRSRISEARTEALNISDALVRTRNRINDCNPRKIVVVHTNCFPKSVSIIARPTGNMIINKPVSIFNNKRK
jgi:hypothetical protein